MNDFKVGDWVKPIYGKSFKQILEVDNSKALETFILIPEGLAPTWFNAKWFTKWQPQEGEWCWYYNELVNVIGFDEDNDLHIQRTFNDENEILKKHKQVYIEPFIGKLPSFIKDN